MEPENGQFYPGGTEGGAGLCAGRTECEKRGCAAEVFCKISKKTIKEKQGCHRCSAGEDQ